MGKNDLRKARLEDVIGLDGIECDTSGGWLLRADPEQHEFTMPDGTIVKVDETGHIVL